MRLVVVESDTMGAAAPKIVALDRGSLAGAARKKESRISCGAFFKLDKARWL
jgi:hypothetical protein